MLRFVASALPTQKPNRRSEMPKGRKGERRPADVIGASVMVGKIATGEIEEPKASAKSTAAELGSKGGKARVKALAS